jgi:hypothetical protein
MALATGFGSAEKPEASALPLIQRHDSYFSADPKPVGQSFKFHFSRRKRISLIAGSMRREK